MKCFHNPGYFVPLPDNHPFPVEKYPLLANKLNILHRDQGYRAIELCISRPIHHTDALLVHSEEYLSIIQSQLLSKYARNRLGLPYHPRWLERSFLDVGGTLDAAIAALQEGIAWNLGGGTHHAMKDEGLGFCVLNDVAIVASILLKKDPTLKILVLDTDAHQGNGTHRFFKDCPEVFTFSIHVGANYPAKKEPGDLDVELPRYVSGVEYLLALDAGLEQVAGRFRPDIVFWVSGVDVLNDDCFGQMRLSINDMKERDRSVAEFVRSLKAPLVGTLGGGYPEDRSKLADYHLLSVLSTLAILG